VGRTGRAITFVTPAQRDEIARIERDVKTKIGEWERPEDRLEHAPPPRRRERKGKAEQAAGNGAKAAASGNAKLFINRGKRSGVTEKDLRWVLREGAIVPDEDIGSVNVLERFSFVEVKADHADRAVEYLDGTKLHGHEIRLEIAKS
jgi:ATP-dependent RNA helicase DeaD